MLDISEKIQKKINVEENIQNDDRVEIQWILNIFTSRIYYEYIVPEMYER